MSACEGRVVNRGNGGSFSLACDGRFLESPADASAATPPPWYVRNWSLPVASVLYSDDRDTDHSVFSGTALVLMSMPPPVNSPWRSGVKVFVTVKLSTVPVGKRSSWTALRRRSALGIRTPLRVVPVYRSVRPRTEASFPAPTTAPTAS